MAAMLVLFIALVAVIYAHGHRVRAYTFRLFLLKLFIAVLFAWIFRLTDAIASAALQHQSPRIPVVLFYLSYVVVVATTLVFARVTRHDMLPQFRDKPYRKYMWLRVVSTIAVLIGLALEFTRDARITELVRLTSRWCVAVILFWVALIYFVGRPWRRFAADY